MMKIKSRPQKISLILCSQFSDVLEILDEFWRLQEFFIELWHIVHVQCVLIGQKRRGKLPED